MRSPRTCTSGRRAQEAKRARCAARRDRSVPHRDRRAKCHEHIAPCRAPTAALALGLMHVLIARGLARPRLHRAPHAGLCRAGASARWHIRRSASAAICGIDAGAIVERWRTTTGTSARRRSASITACSALAAAAMRCAPSPACRRWPGTGATRPAACCCRSSGAFAVDDAALTRPDLLAGRDAAHDQHERDRATALAAGRTAGSRRSIVYNSNPVAVAPRFAQRGRAGSRARTCSPWCSSTS